MSSVFVSEVLPSVAQSVFAREVKVGGLQTIFVYFFEYLFAFVLELRLSVARQLMQFFCGSVNVVMAKEKIASA